MSKKEKQAEKMNIKRHSMAHILATAMLEMFPETKFGIGPATDDGFYYDFDLPRTLIPEDLEILEEKMKKIIKANYKFEMKEMEIDDAIEHFRKANQLLKIELLEKLKDEGTAKVGVYKSGPLVDLCKGPHLDSTGEVDSSAFKLTRISGAYWLSDESKQQLQRVYGVVFNDKKALKQYLFQQEEAKKRDHRKLGKELDLFTFSQTVGQGLPLWTEKGATLRRIIENYTVEKEIAWGYKHVRTPDIARLDLYKKSGHYPYYKDSMYPPMEMDGDEFMLRPMTCPHHFELYLSKPHSYKELPVRIAELAGLYRYEQSGELSGLIRVRNFCLADAHIICADDKQAGEEVKRALDLIDEIAKDFGLKLGENYWYRLSLGNRKDTKKYYDAPDKWNRSENILRKVLKDRKAPFTEEQDEAAFYGPKIDVQMKKINGQDDTAFTVQYDFVMPERFDLEYVAENGTKKKAIVIHRSSVGAIERIIAFLIEHYAGAFPFWLAPVQVALLPVSEKFADYTEKVNTVLRQEGLRTEIHNQDEGLGKRIALASKQKIPYLIIIGEKEVADRTITLRQFGTKEQKTMSVDKFLEEIKKDSN